MSTKNLARTVIEGGRTARSKDARRQCTRFARQQARMYIQRGLKDPEHFDEFNEFDYREWDVRDQADKLSPAYRWLDKHSGQSWDEVWSKLKKLFDNRNVAQRHVVYDHMLGEVHGNGVRREALYRHLNRKSYLDPGELHVGHDGVLRGHTWYWRRDLRASKRVKPRYTKKQVLDWLGDRRIIDRGNGVYFWCEPVITWDEAYAAWFKHCHGFDPVASHYRQTERLAAEDVEIVEHLLQVSSYLGYREMLFYKVKE